MADQEKRVTLYGRVFINGSIKAVTGLHIGGAAGALEVGGVDAPVIRDPLTNRPYIPGSSLRGKMRSLTEKMTGSVQNFRIGTGVHVHVCKTANDDQARDLPPEQQPYNNCLVCPVFGVPGDQYTNAPTRLVVRDVFMSDVSAEKLQAARTDLPYSEVKWEATIDRVTSAAVPRQIERVPAGAEFEDFYEALGGQCDVEDPGHVERFLREAQSAASLNHPNIVQIYAVSEEDGRHYFVMEYVSGRSLQQILRTKGPLEPVQVARIALQTASGLGAAHEQGIIHRDIKPANLLIDNRGIVKIADFGLALMGDAASRLTATGMFMGTPGYLSPEQCLDQGVDNRTDIYSLGVTLFEALSGKTPFVADSPLALLRQIVDVEPPDLGELNPEVDPELCAIVARMMAKDRDLRVASCDELIGTFEAYLEARGAAGNLVERLAVSPPATPPQPVANPTLDTEPTTAMSGDPSPPGSPPDPPRDTATPAARTEPLIVETSPLENEPTARRGTSLALVAALVVVLGLAAVVVAGFFAWRSGFFEAATRAMDGGVSAKHAPGAGVLGLQDNQNRDSDGEDDLGYQDYCS